MTSFFLKFHFCFKTELLRLNHCLLVHVLGSPRVDGDDDEEDVDDIDNEFNYAQGNSKARQQWQGDDAGLSSSSRHESQQPIPLLTNGQQVSDICVYVVILVALCIFVSLVCCKRTSYEVLVLHPYMGLKRS